MRPATAQELTPEEEHLSIIKDVLTENSHRYPKDGCTLVLLDRKSFRKSIRQKGIAIPDYLFITFEVEQIIATPLDLKKSGRYIKNPRQITRGNLIKLIECSEELRRFLEGFDPDSSQLKRDIIVEDGAFIVERAYQKSRKEQSVLEQLIERGILETEGRAAIGNIGAKWHYTIEEISTREYENTSKRFRKLAKQGELDIETLFLDLNRDFEKITFWYLDGAILTEKKDILLLEKRLKEIRSCSAKEFIERFYYEAVDIIRAAKAGKNLHINGILETIDDKTLEYLDKVYEQLKERNLAREASRELSFKKCLLAKDMTTLEILLKELIYERNTVARENVNDKAKNNGEKIRRLRERIKGYSEKIKRYKKHIEALKKNIRDNNINPYCSIIAYIPFLRIVLEEYYSLRIAENTKIRNKNQKKREEALRKPYERDKGEHIAQYYIMANGSVYRILKVPIIRV